MAKLFGGTSYKLCNLQVRSDMNFKYLTPTYNFVIVSIWDLAPVVHSLQSLAGLIKSQLILNLNIFRATEV